MSRISAYFTLVTGWVFGAGRKIPPEVLADLPDTVDQVPFTLMDGSETTLSGLDGQAFLLVNVASQCGFTSQYAGLQALHERYSPEGLVVIGFPANDFLGQEPASNEEIVEFCRTSFAVGFRLARKIGVQGKDIHPLYAFLTSPEKNPEFSGGISWNFNKFVLGREGRILARFGARTTPDDRELVDAIESALEGPDKLTSGP